MISSEFYVHGGGEQVLLSEFIEKAERLGVVFRKNPARTIRYYINLGVLGHPEIVQVGKKRVQCFNNDHLVRLQLISYYKAQGYSLAKINEHFNDQLYWTKEGIEFITPFIAERSIPDSILKSGSIVTRGSMFLLLSLLLKLNEEKKEDIPNIGMFFSDKKGDPFVLPDFVLRKSQWI